MAYNPDGSWSYEDDSVAPKVAGLLKADSPLMQAATTQGLKTANSRGLVNSSLAETGALDAMTKVAVPIASQDASNIAAKNLSRQQTGQQMEINAPGLQNQKDIAGMNIASNDKEKLAAFVAQNNQSYLNSFGQVLQNTSISSADRTALLNHLKAVNDQDLNLAEQMYGVNLSWAEPTL